MYSYFRSLLICAGLLILIALTSCQKELSFSNETNRVDSVSVGSFDSTQLIRSVLTFDWNSGDSVVEAYSYDTLNRKVTINWTGLTDPFSPDPIKAELAYNNDSMLTHIAYTYPVGYTPQSFDVVSMEITYDGDKILHEIRETHGDGGVESKQYTRTPLSSGNYQLSWDISDPAMPNSTTLRRAVFNSSGRNIISITDDSFIAETSPAGDPIYTNLIVSDSLFYDGSESISKVIRNTVDTLRHTNQNYVMYNFSRAAKGDQLYKHRQRLLRGIAQMPFTDRDPSFILGFTGYGLDNQDWQYSRYPLLSADISWLGTDYHFNANAQFDLSDRLVRFNMFFLDLDLSQAEVRVRYYK